jgi:hypothetical protein
MPARHLQIVTGLAARRVARFELALGTTGNPLKGGRRDRDGELRRTRIGRAGSLLVSVVYPVETSDNSVWAPAANWRLQLASDSAEGGADSRADQCKRANGCDCNQRRDQAVFDGRNAAFVSQQRGQDLHFKLL